MGDKQQDEVLLEVKDLITSFRIKDTYHNAVDGVSFDLKKNEVLAIVGESGCGKSTLATSIMGLHNFIYTKVSGEIKFEGNNLVDFTEKDFNNIRGAKIGMIFQDPLSALNPLMRIGDQIEEGLKYHTTLTFEERQNRVKELITKVGINNPERVMKQFPHELSGGMRQRIIIAIALSCKPDILIADEPTTALDVTIQAQILDLLRELQSEIGAGIILITHDLGVVAEMADRVAVMYAGEIVEIATVYDLFKNPQHPYTKSLLSSIPQMDSNSEDDLHVIHGTVPSLKNLPRKGCRFRHRIPWINENEHEEVPTLHEVEKGHFVRCTCYKNFYFAKEGEK
ncbi:ABC transporter ATP-binding protein [Streptobacillus moniliformis]|uniref:Oligopeptide/dipeptide ABC transporter, ATPase subunit n=1 Tax=Streptobacillus moniliformis (strain ATCC 14647 / DSM 12112 / NCTC 10651 / 9901) TaxID=519441 RepID=D1AYN4_STRM9|nr:ABC transporter ATP-binding protein [Streptobacillus moniliformis]ACZ01410.1 oligopeptide/dipeptide ABC transporter, ATPase subunit [Streptobacillus moniliformis DSM 12112]AVL43578.1 ABC transporter ATP-binding protein [Streptobacillus moniliformis]QXW66097.1 ABC transporter ATP-binding protein [Streptobacillus moniliformis]SQA13430.1 Glutathione import ATP-binding protein GsiA [Streptobacillus moniliformis]